jgi:hypothetical protein
MEAAESIFEGRFDNVKDDDEDVEMHPSAQEPKKKARLAVGLMCFDRSL